ncbi:MAG TPA: DUF5719 family protein [Actinomycetota bacterium]|nr:DUF5719 family protein [Actinomycetota bacterium]
MRRYEILFAFVVVVILVGSWALDRIVPAHTVAGGAASGAGESPGNGSSNSVLSEAWYCPVPTPEGLGSSVQTVDLGSGSALLRLTGLGTGSGATTTATAAPRSMIGTPVAPSPAPEPAQVEAFGQHTYNYLSAVNASAGGTESVCGQQPGSRWLFAQASTAPGYDTHLLIGNPFPEDAVVTVRVLGPNGANVPPGLGNYPLSPKSQTAIFLGDYYPETTSFGLDVTANRGRILVARLMKVASTDGVRGLSLSLGVPEPSTQWIFPGGQVPSSGEEDLVIANPSDHEALVNESFFVAAGAQPSAGQQNVSIPAGEQVSLVVSDSVPAGTQHGTVISSANGVPVVAERVTVEGSGSSRGYETVFGTPSWGQSWVVPAGSTAGGTDTLGVVANGLSPATVGVTVVTGTGSASPSSLSNLSITPGSRGSFDLTPYLNGQPGLALVTASSGSIAVENDVALPSNYRETIETVGSPGG